jgi:hypothetical protein
VLVALEDGDELLSDVFDAAHVAGLNEILQAPGSREFRLFPGVVDVEEGKVVAAVRMLAWQSRSESGMCAYLGSWNLAFF